MLIQSGRLAWKKNFDDQIQFKRERKHTSKDVNSISPINCTCSFLFVNVLYVLVIYTKWIGSYMYVEFFPLIFILISLCLCCSLFSLWKWFSLNFFFRFTWMVKSPLCMWSFYHLTKKNDKIADSRYQNKPQNGYPLKSLNLAIWFISAKRFVACGTMIRIFTSLVNNIILKRIKLFACNCFTWTQPWQHNFVISAFWRYVCADHQIAWMFSLFPFAEVSLATLRQKLCVYRHTINTYGS